MIVLHIYKLIIISFLIKKIKKVKVNFFKDVNHFTSSYLFFCKLDV